MFGVFQSHGERQLLVLCVCVRVAPTCSIGVRVPLAVTAPVACRAAVRGHRAGGGRLLDPQRVCAVRLPACRPPLPYVGILVRMLASPFSYQDYHIPYCCLWHLAWRFEN